MTHKLLWLTDIHLDFLTEWSATAGVRMLSSLKVESFCHEVLVIKPDSIIITGDISQGNILELHLEMLKGFLPNIPIRFILGNHDYYATSIKRLRSRLAVNYTANNPHLNWLNVCGVTELTPSTALVGHDGWYDGGYADWFKSRLVMSDYSLIEELNGLPPTMLHERLQQLAFEGAQHAKQYLKLAAAKYKNVIFATHAPPFRENSRAPNGALSDADWLPVMSCKVIGDELRFIAANNPQTQFHCLSGHTHTAWEERYSSNLLCSTGAAKYGKPATSFRVLDIE